MKRYVGGLLAVCLVLNWYVKTTFIKAKTEIVKLAQHSKIAKRG